MHFKGWVFFKSGYPVGVFSGKVKKISDPLNFLEIFLDPLNFHREFSDPLTKIKENEWKIKENYEKLRKIFTPLKFFEKIFAPLKFFAKNFAPLKKHSNRVSGLKKDPPLTNNPKVIKKCIWLALIKGFRKRCIRSTLYQGRSCKRELAFAYLAHWNANTWEGKQIHAFL